MAECSAKEGLLKLLEKCPDDKVSLYIHTIIDVLCGQPPPLHDDFGDIWTPTEWWDVVGAWKDFLKQKAKQSLTQTELMSDLEFLPSTYKTIVWECLDSRQEELEQALLHETCAIDSTWLKDFDWKLKFVLSSDKMANISQPLLELDLDLQEGNQASNLSLELSKEELERLINSLESAHKALLQLTT